MNNTKNDWIKIHTLRGEITKDNISKEFNVYNTELEKCYHYTSLDVFWLIIENEVIRATNIMFSNDSEEYKAGKKIAEYFIGNDYLLSERSLNYMICFCEKENLLSQWREYARKGICIEFDFTKDNCFKIINNRDNDNSMFMYCEPIKVLYTNFVNNTVYDDEKLKLMDIRNTSLEGASCFDLKLAIDKFVENHNEIPENYNKMVTARTLVPYIKHIDFFEEIEKRMIFTLTDREEIDYVFFATDDYTHIKKPYINIKCEYENVEENCNLIEIGNNLSKDLQKSLLKRIYEYSKKIDYNINVELIDGNDIYISGGKNQEELFWIIDSFCNDFRMNDIKSEMNIWCHGHWPIRSVTIAPSDNQDIIKESIEKYKQKIYWLKYIKVKKSTTPYRTKK